MNTIKKLLHRPILQYFLVFALTLGVASHFGASALYLGLLTGIFIAMPFLFIVICFFYWSDLNRSGRPMFFVKGRENRSMTVMRGEELHKVILPSKSVYNDENNDIQDLPADRKRLKQKSFFGMQWIGWWPLYKIHYRRQQWQEWKLKPVDPAKPDGDMELKLITRNEMTPVLIVKPLEYGMLLRDAEDKNMLPINLPFSLTIIPTNTVRPIHLNDDAFGQLQTIALTNAMLFVKDETFRDIGAENQDQTNLDVKNDRFSEKMCGLNAKIPGRFDGQGIIEALGYKILSAKIQSPEIAGEDKKALLEASTMAYKAEEKKKADILLSEGQMQATKNKAEGRGAELKVEGDYFKRISKIPGALEVEKRRATPGVTTLVENGSGTSLLVK